MFIEQLPVIFRFHRGTKWRKSHKDKTIYLTFDDGPIPGVTPWVLDVLDHYGVKATFFCVGQNVERHPEIFEEIVRRGHRVGNHTFNHLKGLWIGRKKYLQNVERAAALIPSDLFRPPHGLIGYGKLREIRKHYTVVFWDVVTRDYNASLRPGLVYRKACRYVRNGSIVVFHDSLKAERNMKETLPRFLAYCRQQGYEFGLL